MGRIILRDRRGRPPGVVLAAVALVAALLLPASGAAGGGVELVRLAGPERIATAVAVSQQQWPSADRVVLARADVPADALAATAHAGGIGPILLTPGDQLAPSTAAEIARLGASRVTLVGGTTAISTTVEQELTGRGLSVERLAGANRFATAAAIATATAGNPTAIFMADGHGFADALVAGVAAGAESGVVVLAAGDQLPAETRAYLDAHPQAPVIAVGQDAAAAAGSRATETVVGVDVYDTAQQVARRFFPAATEIGLASGENFPDALSGGAHAATRGIPLLLTRREGVPASVVDYLDEIDLQRVWVYGGTAAISDVAANTAAGRPAAPSALWTLNDSDSTVSRRDATTGAEQWRAVPPFDFFTQVSWESDGARFAGGNIPFDEPGSVAIVDGATGTVIGESPWGILPTDVDWEAGTSRIAAVDFLAPIVLIDADDPQAEPVRVPGVPHSDDGFTTTVEWLSGGRLAYLLTERDFDQPLFPIIDGAVWLVGADGSQPRRLALEFLPEAIAASPSGNLLAVQSSRQDRIDVFNAAGDRVESYVGSRFVLGGITDDGAVVASGYDGPVEEATTRYQIIVGRDGTLGPAVATPSDTAISFELPVFDETGTMIAFSATTDCCHYPGRGEQIGVVAVDGSGLTILDPGERFDEVGWVPN